MIREKKFYSVTLTCNSFSTCPYLLLMTCSFSLYSAVSISALRLRVCSFSRVLHVCKHTKLSWYNPVAQAQNALIDGLMYHFIIIKKTVNIKQKKVEEKMITWLAWKNCTLKIILHYMTAKKYGIEMEINHGKNKNLQKQTFHIRLRFVLSKVICAQESEVETFKLESTNWHKLTFLNSLARCCPALSAWERTASRCLCA